MSDFTVDLEDIECVFLDLDGTIYLGSNLIPGATDFLARCKRHGVKRFFLSNNSSRSVEEYLAKLQSMEIAVEADEVLLSTHDLISYLREVGHGKICLVGTEGMREMMQGEGFVIDDEAPDAVVLGYDTEINYQKISNAAKHLHNGVPLVASHPDIVCPSPDGGLPDTGAYMAMFEAATGVRPTHVCGKPQPSMIMHKIEEIGLLPEKCAMIGDRLYTDIEMANRSGVKGILVLSGEATISDVESSKQTPDLVVGSVAELLPGV